MQRLLAFLLVLLLAFSVACGDDSDDDDSADAPTPTVATGSGVDAAATTSDAGGGGDGDAATGEAIAQAQCVACHSIDGSTVVGPTWKGLAGSEVELESGETVTADDAYLRESIKEPGAKLHAGFANLMPVIQLSDKQIGDLIAYIKTLE